MRRAGYEVRVWPEECGSWEENPPTLADFSRRDVRWCQGNLQYAKLLRLPGLLPMSRFQLAWAILMFLGIPAWTLLIALLPFKAMDGEAAGVVSGRFGDRALSDVPRRCICRQNSQVSRMFSPRSARSGSVMAAAALFLAGAAIELAFSFLVGAATTLADHACSCSRLPFGKSASWNGQERDAHALSWRSAVVGPLAATGLRNAP